MAHETLRNDHAQRGGQQERLDPHVAQPRYSANGVIGVDSRQDKVAGEAGLHGDLRSLRIAHLADHDDVRILPQDSAQTGGKCHSHLGVDLRLADTFNGVFDGVLDGEDIPAAIVEEAQASVKRGGLAGARRAGHQNNPIRFAQGRAESGSRGGRHTEIVELKPGPVPVQQAQHDAFARLRGQGRDAHIKRAVADGERDAAVLR